ncbi:methionyl-tRNA formyltransferase [Achromatium sp. WMS3]|nr:methionyl-tRNA formyltransferase [Achromatium sp. WMS3]
MPNTLRIIFAGTPEFAALPLQSLINHGYQIIAVYTQPDRPTGRGRKITASPVKKLAFKYSIPVYQPESLKQSSVQQELQNLNADLMIVAAYGLLLPKAVLAMPRLGCVNIHASLLPRWRGAAPIQRAILAGDTETGITIMQMAAGLDTGPIITQESCSILATDTSAILHDRLATLGANLLLTTLPLIASGKPPLQLQDSSVATYAAKLEKQEAMLDWTQPAQLLERKVRAFNPWPVASTYYDNGVLRIWEAYAIAASLNNHNVNIGTVIATSPKGIDIITGQDLLRITCLQLPNKRKITAAEFINARDILGVSLA